MSTPSGVRLTARRSGTSRLLAVGIGAVFLLAVAAAAVALVIHLGHHSASASTGAQTAGPSAARVAKYGGLPKWLPKAKVPVGRVLTATTTKPVLAIQGETVSVHLEHGKVLATAVGPQVPEDGEFPVPATSPCTFVVTFTSADGVVPLDPSEFTIRDEEGHFHHPV